MAEILDLDAILADASPAEKIVPLCLNGKVRRQYDEVKARIDQRAAEAEAATLAQRAADTVDDRLGVKTGSGDPAPAAAGDDPEAGLLADLEAKMRAATVPFTLAAIPSQQFNELIEKHPPRKDPATGRIDVRDAQGGGVNVQTFYPELVKLAIVAPVMDDAQHDRVMGVLSDAQFNRLAAAAGELNTQDDDIPFSLSDLEIPPG